MNDPTMLAHDAEMWPAISQQIWHEKYRYGEEASIADSWQRVATALASVEDDAESWPEAFHSALSDFRFLPAGRIQAGAGTGRAVTLFNCFVMGTVPDDLGGIFTALREAALTLQQGGGIGYDFSTLRPKGAPVRGVGADASGPLSFMDVWNSMCGTIMSAGARRGAMMATLRCDHPDIDDFVAAKRDPARLRMFNLSVLVTDPFMQTVAEDGDWDLVFGGTVWKTVRARDLWDRILRATYDVAEPGVIFIDRINRLNPLSYCESIAATNPCVVGSTWVQTDAGPRQARDLKGADFAVVVDGAAHPVAPPGFFRRGRKAVFDVMTVEGYRLRVTADHRVYRSSGGEGYPGWTMTQDLRPGDELALQDHRTAQRWGERREDVQGYLAGLDVLSGPCGVTWATETRSFSYQRGFLRALLDSRGRVTNSGDRRHDEVLVTIPEWWAETGALTVQRMLLRLGIVSRIDTDTFEIVIADAHLRRLRDVVGFRCDERQAELRAAAAAARPGARFIATVQAIVPAGKEDVWDVSVPGVNAYDADGFRSHNCGEQPLPPYGACLLGSVNLARFVKQPFAAGTLDLEALRSTVTVAVRMLDNAIDVSRFPLPEQQAEAQAKRRIGLGVTGLADALVMCGIRYGSDEAVDATRTWLREVRDAAARSSVDLAREKGTFPLFDAERYLEAPGVQDLPDDIRDGIREHGIRNGLLTSIAPTGTISLLAGNLSSGIEPIFALEYERTVLERDGSRRTQPVVDHAVRLFRRIRGPDAPLPDAFVTAQELTPAEHIAMQGAAQEFVDSAISKTVNVPETISFDEFRAVYQAAWDAGCKGCTTYRPNPITGAVLSVTESAVDTGPAVLIDRPAVVGGRTYKMRWPGSDHAIYITVNDVDRNGRRVPFEVFINSKNMGHYAWTVALTRMISAVFRRGGDVSFVAEELQQVFDPRGGAWIDRKYVPSLLAAIGGVIERHLRAIGFLDVARSDGNRVEQSGDVNAGAERPGGECGRCGAFAVVRMEGCELCTACGFSNCS